VAAPAPDGHVEEHCWIRIGVWGDATCPELRRVAHCHNCEVYSAAGRQLLVRPAPDGYIDWWTGLLAEDRVAEDKTLVSFLVFRVGQTWLALRATSMQEITHQGTIRSVPHRPREILLGLVNIRGELQPCVSLHALFGEETPAPMPSTARFLVARTDGLDWVFPVDQIDGMHDVGAARIEKLPATLEQTEVAYSRGLFHAGDKTVAIVDEELLFSSLTRRIA
jgi:chemotaxis-related protein WspD